MTLFCNTSSRTTIFRLISNYLFNLVQMHILLRKRNADAFFVEGKLFDHEPSSWPRPAMKIGLGVGFNRAILRFGISDAGFYMHPYVPVYQEKVWLKPFFAFAGRDFYQLNCVIGIRFNF